MTRVAFDATPLLGERTGVGVLTMGVLQALSSRSWLSPQLPQLPQLPQSPQLSQSSQSDFDLDLRAFALTWRGRHALAAAVPEHVRTVPWPMAATALQRLWTHADGPVIEWWTGPLDVVHGTNFVVPPAARAARVVTVHDLTAIRYPELCAPATRRYPALIRRAVRTGAWVHTFSHAMAGEVVDLIGAPPERVRVVAPGPPEAGPAGSGLTVPALFEADRPYVLSLGRAEPRKDLPLLIRAFDEVALHHRDLDLVLAGPPGWAEEALTAAIAGARHRDRIRRLGWVSDSQKAALLARAAVFAYPSVYEGFGIPPLEAMAAGVPVVATAAGGVPEAVGPAAVLVPVGDVAALASALTRLVDDAGERASLVAAGRRQVARFSWATCAQELHALYGDAAASRAR